MARPKKQRVDYFPHSCSHGSTMYILEQKYGNDGYSFWFKLLESLGSTEGHYLDLRCEAKWEFLQAKTRLDAKICQELLDLLAKLNAIDPELWLIKIVWSSNFIGGISDVYKNRRVETPSKPTFLLIETPQVPIVSTHDNTQSKLKESKLNKALETKTPVDIKEQEIKEICKAISNVIPKQQFNPYSWCESFKGKNPEAIIHTMKRILKEAEFIVNGKISNPWGYAKEIISKEDGKYNAQEYVKEHQMDFTDVVNKLRQIHNVDR